MRFDWILYYDMRRNGESVTEIVNYFSKFSRNCAVILLAQTFHSLLQ